MNERLISPQCKFRPYQRLTRPREFELVLNHSDGRFQSGPVRILFKSSVLENARLGLVVPKRVVRMATERNRVKRTIREWFRTNAREFPSIDVVVVIRSRPARGGDICQMVRWALQRWKDTIGSS